MFLKHLRVIEKKRTLSYLEIKRHGYITISINTLFSLDKKLTEKFS